MLTETFFLAMSSLNEIDRKIVNGASGSTRYLDRGSSKKRIGIKEKINQKKLNFRKPVFF